MASITPAKEPGVFYIQISDGFDVFGERIRYCDTVTIDRKLKGSKKKKELDIAVKKLEEKLKESCVPISKLNTTFADFTKLWLNTVKLERNTIKGYTRLLKRIIPAIGHYKLNEITALKLVQFYKTLEEDRIVGSYIPRKERILLEMKKQNKTKRGLARETGLSLFTVKKIINGENTQSAKEFSTAFDLDVKKLFKPVNNTEELSGRYIHHHHALIRNILNKAVKWDYIESNPALKTEAPEIEDKPVKVYDDSDIEYILELISGETLIHKAIFYITVFSGMRRGELSGLEWMHINFENNTILVEQALYQDKDGIYLKGTKTNRDREIDMPEFVMELLAELKKHSDKMKAIYKDEYNYNLDIDDDPHEFIFCHDDGKCFYPNTPSQWWAKFRKRNDLEHVTFHGLRHTNATLLLAENIAVTTVAGRLGHVKPETTMKIYGHFLQKKGKEAATQLNDRFGNFT